MQYWIKSGRAESEGRLEQWNEFLSLQEEYALRDSFRKVVAQVRRTSFHTRMHLVHAYMCQNSQVDAGRAPQASLSG